MIIGMLLLTRRSPGAVRYGGRGASFCVVIVSLLLFVENMDKLFK